MLKPSIVLTCLLTLVGLVMLARQASDWRGVLFAFPFALGPLLLNLLPAYFFRSRVAQAILLLAAVAYAIWFCWIYYQAFVASPDPQSSIGLLIVGLYALPVMVLLWLAAAYFEWSERRDTASKEGSSVVAEASDFDRSR